MLFNFCETSHLMHLQSFLSKLLFSQNFPLLCTRYGGRLSLCATLLQWNSTGHLKQARIPDLGPGDLGILSCGFICQKSTTLGLLVVTCFPAFGGEAKTDLQKGQRKKRRRTWLRMP